MYDFMAILGIGWAIYGAVYVVSTLFGPERDRRRKRFDLDGRDQ